MAGDFDSKLFRRRYGFLSEMHKEELTVLRDNLKRARKLLTSSPRDLRSQRAQEVEKLERALKRAESTVNRDKREKIEEDALSQVAHEEREKQKHGKKAFYMKNGKSRTLRKDAPHSNYP